MDSGLLAAFFSQPIRIIFKPLHPFAATSFQFLRQIVLGRLKEIGQKFDRLFGRRVFPTPDTRIVIFRRPNGRLRGLAGRARRCGWLGLSKLILSAW
jgi:hypothetical protein